MKKRCFLLLMIVFSSIGLVACNSKGRVTTLDTPKNLVVENQIISFDEVDNASYYMINYDGNTITIKPSGTGEIIFDASKIFGEAKTYEIKVKAIGTGNYKNSNYTSIFEYTKTQNFDTPTVKINGQTLTWTAIDDAKYYTIKAVYPNGSQGIYTYSSNLFDIKPLLQEVGVYKFQVKVGEEQDDNDYSPEISYTYEKQLDTPSNLSLHFDKTKSEVYLYFVSDVNTYSYLMNVNNVDYVLSEAYIDTYLENAGYDNLKKLKLFAFLNSQNANVEELKNLAVTVTSKSASTDHYINSATSPKAYLTIKQLLASTTLTATTSSGGKTLSWNKVDGATGYAVYKNLNKLITLDSNTTSIVIDSEMFNSNVYSVKVEGSDEKCDSVMSNFVGGQSLSQKASLSFVDNKISWTSADDVKLYYLEIFNDQSMFATTLEETEFDMTSFEFDKYTARLRYLNSENAISNMSTVEIDFKKTLDKPTNISIGNEYSRYTVNFEKIDGAIGYAVKLNDNLVPKVWTTNTIDLTEYILVNGQYNLQIKAVAPIASNIQDSDWTNAGSIQHAVKLAKPQISVINNGEKYILKVDRVENAEKYNILVNYISIYEGGVEYVEEGYDISSYFVSAQVYSVMVQALAPVSNISFVDSDFEAISVPKYVQLETINSDKIDIISRDGKYFLDFPTQTHAANYDVRIVNMTSEKEQIININSLPYDITNYIASKGEYRIYVKAKANTDLNYLYVDAAESGNPYILEKGKETLSVVSNISVGEKDADANKILLTWTSVANADSYYINMYYQSPNSKESVMTSEINVLTNQLNIGDYISKEGKYTFKIKSVSSKDYESSAFSTFAYDHTITVKSDFERYKVFMNGSFYSHYITSYEQLKNILWHYYLFNENTYKDPDTGFEYLFKIMLGTDIETLEEQCQEENSGFDVETDDNGNFYETKIRLHIVANYALSSYQEGVCLKGNVFNPPTEISKSTGNYFEYNYTQQLKSDKTDVVADYGDTIAVNPAKKFDQKSNELPTSQQRQNNNVFVIDAKEKVDVTTTEQLFMVVQYDKAPNFVGNCEVAQTVYNNCRSVLNTIINYSMTDYQKVEAIYNWLVANVEYNDNFTRLMRVNPYFNSTIAIDSTILMGDCKYNYLEGVFYDPADRSAAANGFAKAFVLMCKIEGIDAVKVYGAKDGYAHYWNKVYLDVTPNNGEDDGAWFTVDIASGFKQICINATDYFAPTHKYFLVTDAYLQSEGMLEISCAKSSKQRANTKIESTTTFNYYANTWFEYEKYMVKSTGKVKYSGAGYLQFGSVDNSATDVDNYLKDVIRYMVTQTQKNTNMSITEIVSMFAIEVDMSNYKQNLTSVVANITTSYYEEIHTELNATFNIYAEAYDSKIIIAIKPSD